MGPNCRGRPPGRLRERVKEYMCEREMLQEGKDFSKQEESVWVGRSHDHLLSPKEVAMTEEPPILPTQTLPRESEVSRAIDKKISR